ncbi:MAG: phosphatase PAP2 family protein [Chloroflexia bacterium]|nr:phosphatase PAP2 family protein [Chloroflexia bacterium]
MAESRPPDHQGTPGNPEMRKRRFTFDRFDVSRLRTRDFQIRLAIALVLIVVSVFTNRQYLGWGLFAVLAVLILPYGRARSLLGAFVPYALVWFIFSFLRSLADETRWARRVNTAVADFERWLFNGELPTIRLQADWYTPGSLHLYDYYFTFIHWSYFLVPHTVAVYLWWKKPEKFRQYLLGLIVLLTLGLALYFALPSNPPWMAPESVNSPGAPTTLRIMEPIGRQLGGGLYQAGYNVVGESNPIAAMPSIHFAVTFLLFWVAMDYGKWWRIAAAVYSLSMAVALIYMGEHYVVDILAGGAVTTIGWIAAGAWIASGHSFLPSWRRGESAEQVAEWPSTGHRPVTE